MFLLKSTDSHSYWDAPVNRQVGPAVVVAALLGLTWLLWILPIGYCLWSYYWVARRWKPISAPVRPWLQVEGDSGERRFCNICHIYCGDRTYHKKYLLDKCLPFYDHTCYWWTGAVWLHNVKAYLHFLVFLPVYQLFCVGIAIWVVASPEKYDHGYAFLSVGFVCLTGLVFSISTLGTFGRSLAWHSVLEKERDAGTIFYLDEGSKISSWRVDDDPNSRNPWNRGGKTNFYDIMGPVWTWPFFWTTTPLMRNMECYKRAQGVAIPADIPLQPLPVARRGNGSSTGFEDVDVERQGSSTLTLRSSA